MEPNTYSTSKLILENAALRKELEEAKETIIGFHMDRIRIIQESCSIANALKEERAKSAKLVEALKGKHWQTEPSCFGDGSYEVLLSNVFKTKEDAIDFIETITQYEGKGGDDANRTI